ncbi:hypothetical protein C7999DRAFT_40382 [Corynascus novoguineensis]|uniref:Uncharacterized protein n=1 Tax=Corynascus novoguineensis TaxID=1126955 RepID=A0AAN7HJW7_9PEZI|nr:hypothetical protein C7999DRAFT_40382 [Corynascus novoguineensis]
MSNYKDILKKGWHPEKEGTTLKGQVKSLIGRGDDQTRRSNHVATPITSLRDPASFAPPPKRNPNAVVGASSPTTSSSPASQTGPTVPPRAGTAPEQPPSEEPASQPKPWRLDTTGLSTAHLPPPPMRKDGADGGSSPAPRPAPGGDGAKKAPPSLPPRLPPRSSTASSTANPSPPPRPPPATTSPAPTPGPAQGYLNQSAINRLGAAGISVPGFGITPSSSSYSPTNASPSATPTHSPSTTASPSARSPAPPPGGSHMSELQSRFGQLRTTGTSTTTTAGAAGGGGRGRGGTTVEQKQSALRTAAALRSNPGSVSLSDARAAATAADNFRQRHGEQIAGGLKAVGGVQQRFGGDNGGGIVTGGGAGNSVDITTIAGKKKPPPPPPPPKRKDIQIGVGGLAQRLGQPQGQGQGQEQRQVGGDGNDEPPPIPLATKPRF